MPDDDAVEGEYRPREVGRLMLQSRVTADRRGVSGAIRRGTRRAMEDAADVGLAVSLEHVPDGATSGLRLSAPPKPVWVGDAVVWGYDTPYALAVEEGLPPGHWIPADAIPEVALWAHRVLAADDPESTAWAVRHKIGTEGTDAQPYVARGVEAQRAWMVRNGVAASVEREIR